MYCKLVVLQIKIGSRTVCLIFLTKFHSFFSMCAVLISSLSEKKKKHNNKNPHCKINMLILVDITFYIIIKSIWLILDAAPRKSSQRESDNQFDLTCLCSDKHK